MGGPADGHAGQPDGAKGRELQPEGPYRGPAGRPWGDNVICNRPRKYSFDKGLHSPTCQVTTFEGGVGILKKKNTKLLVKFSSSPLVQQPGSSTPPGQMQYFCRSFLDAMLVSLHTFAGLQKKTQKWPKMEKYTIKC